jgi:hypothetical protein
MQELRLVAVSEDGTYAVLAVPGRGGRFSLPIDDRLRTVARGQFSRLAQYEIEVENPLRPKEIQDRIRAGETADEIADAAGIPIERVRRFEGPVLAEREYRAQEAQRSTVRGHTESGPGPRLGEIVLERLADVGAPADGLDWDSRKRTDGNWQVQLQFTVEGRPQIAEWVFDPRRRQVIPADDLARRLCLPQVDWPAGRLGGLGAATATVTPIGSRQGAYHVAAAEPDRVAARGRHGAGLPAAHSAPPDRQLPLDRQLPETRLPETSRPPELTRPRGTGQAAEPGWAREPEPATAQAGQDPAAARASHPAAPPAASAPAPSAPAASQPRGPASAAPPAAGGHAADGRTADAQTSDAQAANAQAAEPGEQADPDAPARSGRKAASGRGRRSSVPSWDEIMLGNSRQPD